MVVWEGGLGGSLKVARREDSGKSGIRPTVQVGLPLLARTIPSGGRQRRRDLTELTYLMAKVPFLTVQLHYFYTTVFPTYGRSISGDR